MRIDKRSTTFLAAVIFIATACVFAYGEPDAPPAIDLDSPFSVNISQRSLVEGREYRADYRALFHPESGRFRLDGNVTGADGAEREVVIAFDSDALLIKLTADGKIAFREYQAGDIRMPSDNFSLFAGLDPRTYAGIIEKGRNVREMQPDRDAEAGLKLYRVNSTPASRDDGIVRLNIYVSAETGLPARVIGRNANGDEKLILAYSGYRSVEIDDGLLTVEPPVEPPPAE